MEFCENQIFLAESAFLILTSFSALAARLLRCLLEGIFILNPAWATWGWGGICGMNDLAWGEIWNEKIWLPENRDSPKVQASPELAHFSFSFATWVPMVPRWAQEVRKNAEERNMQLPLGGIIRICSWEQWSVTSCQQSSLCFALTD